MNNKMIHVRSSLALAIFLLSTSAAHAHAHTLEYDSELAAPILNTALNGTGLSINSIPYSTRAHWMRQTKQALLTLSGPCPFAAFGSVIVNHTAAPAGEGGDGEGPLGQLVCIGANANSATGNPTMHGEIAAIDNCSRILTDPQGPYKLTPAAALAAFSDLSIYTNGESCPMCASAIRWGGFREYVYGTSIETLIDRGFGQIRISSLEVFKQAFELPGRTRIIGDILANETDPLFSWQFDPAYPCPSGCTRSASGASCVAS